MIVFVLKVLDLVFFFFSLLLHQSISTVSQMDIYTSHRWVLQSDRWVFTSWQRDVTLDTDQQYASTRWIIIRAIVTIDKFPIYDILLLYQTRK